jgi:hypothetical protein
VSAAALPLRSIKARPGAEAVEAKELAGEATEASQEEARAITSASCTYIVVE